MPMQDNQRRRNQEQAGVTDQQVDEAIGVFTVEEKSARASGLSKEQIEAVRQAVRQVGADAAIIAAKYNKIARQSGRNPQEKVGQEEIDADRAHLESLIADEYQFMNPFGNIEGKKRTIDVIMNGRILYDSYGRGGFESTEDSLQVHGDTAVLVSAFTMSGHGEARKTKTGEIYEHDLAGTYRTTHTFVRREERWQYTASQMTKIPEEQDFGFVADEADYQ